MLVVSAEGEGFFGPPGNPLILDQYAGDRSAFCGDDKDSSPALDVLPYTIEVANLYEDFLVRNMIGYKKVEAIIVGWAFGLLDSKNCKVTYNMV